MDYFIISKVTVFNNVFFSAAMLSPQSVVIDFEGFRLSNQPFILKELSVRAADYHDTILLRPPHSSNILNAKAQKAYNWVTKNLHGISWDSGVYDYSFIFCFFISLKVRFPNIVVYAKGKEKSEYLSSFFPHVIDLDTLNCPRASDFNKIDGLLCLNHQNNYQREHCAREKANLFFEWLTLSQQQHCHYCNGSNVQRQYTSCIIPETNNISNNNTTRSNH